MSDNRMADLLGDDNGHEDEAIAALAQLARAHGAESRAADIVAAKALVGRFRFSPALGWLEWDGRRWDADDVAEPRVVETVRQFIDTTERDYRARATTADVRCSAVIDAVFGRCAPEDLTGEKGKPKPAGQVITEYGTPDEQAEWGEASADLTEAKRQADIWLNLLSAGKISAVTKLCRGMAGIVTRSTAFDAYPDLLNCHNGVVDLRTGELHPADPDLLLTHLAGGEYTPGARSPLWEKALTAVHPDIRGWFQIRMGQSITGHTPSDDSLVIAEGGGENGKTAVMSACLRAAGTYGRLISHRVLIAQPGQHPTELMDLRGLRLALLEETPEEGRLDTHQLKTTIGTPQITARRMRRDDVTFDTSHSLWVNTNFLPQVDTTDHGTWRRLKAMPWPFRFKREGLPLRESNDRLGDAKLKGALRDDEGVPAAVLAWMVQGAMAWYANGKSCTDDPDVVVESTSQWRQNSDVGYRFACERLVADDTAFITAEAMRAQFLVFLEEQGKREWSAQTINNRLGPSMLAAGIAVSKDPTKATKVRKGDVASWPAPAGDEQWTGRGAARVDIPEGKVMRLWRGVRFRTAEDDRRDREKERGLKVV